LIFGQQEDREEPGFMHWWRLLKKLENFGYWISRWIKATFITRKTSNMSFIALIKDFMSCYSYRKWNKWFPSELV
jgi:hypothetical protein